VYFPLKKCESIVSVLENINKDIDNACTKGKELSCSLVFNILDISVADKENLTPILSVLLFFAVHGFS
jgi:hypothetical protein